MDVFVFLHEGIAGILVQNMFENFFLWVYNRQEFVNVHFLACSIDNWLKCAVISAFFQVVKEIAHMVPLINKNWLSVLLKEKLVFRILSRGISHVTEVFIAEESVKEGIINFYKKCQSLFGFLWGEHQHFV